MFEYATLDDLEKRYHALVGSDATKAQALIDDATAYLINEFTRSGIDPDPANWEDYFSQAVTGVVCAMTKRSLATSSGADVQSESASVGSYSQTFTYANPTGDIYLKESERRLLNIPLNETYIGTIAPMTNADRDPAEVENGV